jgi:ABC-type multidrug transport system ATPase subunit
MKLTISNLTRRYGAFVAIDDVSFTLRQGEVVVAGKCPLK